MGYVPVFFEKDGLGLIRMAIDFDDSWFVADDVGKILGFADPEKAVGSCVEPRDVGWCDILTPDGEQEVCIVDRIGVEDMCRFALQQDGCLPVDEIYEFAHWFICDVLRLRDNEWGGTGCRNDFSCKQKSRYGVCGAVACTENMKEEHKMMVQENSLQVFENPEFGKIRMIDVDSKPYAVGVDVARALGYVKPSQTVIDHCKGIRKLGIPSYNQHGAEVVQETNCIPEGDIYRLIVKAADQGKNPEIRERAERFERWVCDDIIHRQNATKPIAAEGLSVLDYKGNNVRMQMIDSEPWWVLADVCRVLELSTPAKVADRLSDDEKGMSQIHTLGGMQNMTIINEPGLYNVILRSDKPEAKDFKRWVTHDVLPAIRKHGGYLTPKKIEEVLLNPDTIIQLATQLKEERAKSAALQIENEEQKQQIEAFKPVQNYVDTILSSTSTMTTTQIAADYGMSARALNKILHEEGVQWKVGGQWVLYSKYVGLGYTDSHTYTYTKSDGETGTSVLTKWTQAGRMLIHDILTKRGIKAVVDRESESVPQVC